MRASASLLKAKAQLMFFVKNLAYKYADTYFQKQS